MGATGRAAFSRRRISAQKQGQSNNRPKTPGKSQDARSDADIRKNRARQRSADLKGGFHQPDETKGGAGTAMRLKFPFEGVQAAAVFCVMMNSRTVILGFVLVAPILTGCSSVPSAPTTAQEHAAQPARPDPWLALAKGTTADQVRADLGAPVEVRPMRTPGAEIWIYRRKAVVGVNLVPTATEDVPYVEPTTGQLRTTQNPVYSQETCTEEEELQLLLYEGELVNWKRVLRTKRDYQ